MSEIVLSNQTASSTSSAAYDYTDNSMFGSVMDTKANNNTSSDNDHNDGTSSPSYEDKYTTYPAYNFQSMSMGFAPVTNYHPMSRMNGYFNDTVSATRQPTSPESMSSSSSPSTPHNTVYNTLANSSQVDDMMVNNSSARVKEMIDRANTVPMEFYHTEFLEYSKETYEKKLEKRKRPNQELTTQRKKKKADEDSDEDDEDDTISNAEMKRQIHIQSEQKRRAQIKDGFDELRKHLPGCNNKKMSKAALLTRTVQQLQHLKNMQNELLSEVERLLQENESLKKFQHGVLQRQAMEKMYTF